MRAKDAAFLNGPDISTCQRCGDTDHVWHVWGGGDRRDVVVGMVCTRCLWSCGKATIITAISCKIYEFLHRRGKK